MDIQTTVANDLTAFAATTPVEQFTRDDWMRFAVEQRMAGQREIQQVSVSISAVNLMCQTMADNKTEELIAARASEKASLITSLQSLVDEAASSGDPDAAGLQRALIILERT